MCSFGGHTVSAFLPDASSREEEFSAQVCVSYERESWKNLWHNGFCSLLVNSVPVAGKNCNSGSTYQYLCHELHLSRIYASWSWLHLMLTKKAIFAMKLWNIWRCRNELIQPHTRLWHELRPTFSIEAKLSS